MNSYELLRPDGAGSGIWSCGECHKFHLTATLADKPATEINRNAAEECCAPRDCRYCGQIITERDWSGQFRREHEECIPKYQPVPPHPSMANPYARLLYEKMSGISEDAWCAGWMSGNEYYLWDILHGHHNEYGYGDVSREDREELRILSELARGWIWTGPENEYTPQLVTFAEWESIRAAAGKVHADGIGPGFPGVVEPAEASEVRFKPIVERPVTRWEEQTGYPNGLVSGSQEHQGAHEHLLKLTVEMESDFEPWGKRTCDEEDSADCSCGCRHFAILDGPLGADWGVCINPRSPRAGLVTFEHQGCPQFEAGRSLFGPKTSVT